MKKIKHIFIAIMLMVTLIFSIVVPPASAQTVTTDDYKSAANYMVNLLPNPTFGDEWSIIALARGEYNVPSNYYDTYYKNLEQEIKKVKGILHDRKYTEYSRVVIALSAIGKDATNVGGYNLVEKLYDFDQVIWQGLNGPIFALIALDTWNFELPISASTSREKLISHILSKELSGGGFSLSGSVADPDVTAMALQALAPYKERADVKQVIDNSLNLLAELQNKNGGYNSWENENSESVSQVITALSSLSIDMAQDKRFNNALVNLLSFHHTESGGFKHVKSETKANGMATEQAAYTLAAYNRLLAGKTTLYIMSDTKKQTGEKPSEVIPTKVSFKDTEKHWAKNDIEQAYQRGLLKGFEDGTFRPNNQLTRVQAISILVRALKLENQRTVPFTDMAAYGQETKNEVAAAFEVGLLMKKSGKLEPKAMISREELAIMLGRAYTLQTNNTYVATTIATFRDIQTLTKEAKQAITFLYDFKIASGAYGLFHPANTTTRAEAAKMFVNFLRVVEN